METTKQTKQQALEYAIMYAETINVPIEQFKKLYEEIYNFLKDGK